MVARWGWRAERPTRTQQAGQSEVQIKVKMNHLKKKKSVNWFNACFHHGWGRLAFESTSSFRFSSPERGIPCGCDVHRANVWWREPSAAARSATSRRWGPHHGRLHWAGLSPEVLQAGEQQHCKRLHCYIRLINPECPRSAAHVSYDGDVVRSGLQKSGVQTWQDNKLTCCVDMFQFNNVSAQDSHTVHCFPNTTKYMWHLNLD